MKLLLSMALLATCITLISALPYPYVNPYPYAPYDYSGYSGYPGYNNNGNSVSYGVFGRGNNYGMIGDPDGSFGFWLRCGDSNCGRNGK
ncbi:unnamed protein product [Bursaphelenchus xylophilus]|uniref:(pine wood nematode) hypothetical protein n=1 Tax=Bursaphelenchus xylophilus TaxID=6326 RepID=A0A1I7RZ58_BURXY|nr:unnamed protein product [Bursaphelenchus xylophilus]CAG9106826.1 unnamed protein product [Bursaphelenchus xylophilus]